MKEDCPNIGVMLYELLENRGVLRKGRPHSELIATVSETELLDIAAQAAEITAVSAAPSAVGAFEHSATMGLGGWPRPCSSLECRLRHVLSLGQFAAFYSDRVYIPNFMMDHFAHRGTRSEEVLRSRFLDDVTIFSAIRPLVEAGRVVPVTPSETRCPRCFGLYDAPNSEREQINRTERMLAQEYFRHTKMELFLRGDSFSVRYWGPEELLEHPVIRPLPEWAVRIIEAVPSLHRRLLSGKVVEANASLRKKLRLHDDLALDVLSDVTFELALAQALGTSYLADKQIQVIALNSLGTDVGLNDRNTLIGRYLKLLVPFVAGVDPADLLQLRRREGESFLLFRRALCEAIDEVRKGGSAFTGENARELYSDVLEPRLAELDRRIAMGRRGLGISALGFVGSWTGAITFGMLSGLLPANLTGIAAALGIASVQKGTEALIASKSSRDAVVRTDDLYFLWRVKRLASQAESPVSYDHNHA